MVVESPVAGRRMPADVRSILLLVGYAGLLAIGALNLYEQDWSGLVLVAAALAGAVFVRGRLLNIGIWLGVAVFGLGALAGLDTRGVFPLGIGVVGAVISAWPDAGLMARLRAPAAMPFTDEPLDSTNDEPEPVRPPAELELHTIGRLELRAGDKDLTANLLEHPVLAFMWLHLLARLAAGADRRLDRSALSDEVWPRLDTATQKERFRNQLRAIRKLPSPLANRVQTEGDLVGLDLSGCDFDVNRLRALAAEAQGAGIMSPRLLRRATTLLDEVGTGLFLPGWEEIEHRVTGGRGGAAELVNSARRQVADHRADLALALAEGHLAAGRPANSVKVLETAKVGAPHREDLIHLLISAYVRTGQTKQALNLKSEYGLMGKL